MNSQILALLLRGFNISYGRVSINFLKGNVIDRVEVVSDDFRYLYHQVYNETEFEAAVDKFILILNQIKKKNVSKSKKSNSGMQTLPSSS